MPQIPTSVIATGVWGMFVGRLGSLNALEQTNESRIWKRLLGERPPSADTVGRVVAKMDADSIRLAIHKLYSELKRKKALQAPSHGLIALAIDGHESSCLSERRCEHCIKRKTRDGTFQYYHRNVTAQLIFDKFTLLIDAEPQKPGGGELTAAKILYARVVKTYARAFDVVLGDALYGTMPFIKQILESGKDIIAVMKANAGSVYKQSNHILDQMSPTLVNTENGVERVIRETDEVAFGLSRTFRVIKSVESNLRNSKQKPKTWIWVTSLRPVRARTSTVMQLGHDRWKIENEGFNETTMRWASDHVYKHEANAIKNFWLLCMLSFNTFMCFFFRNLKQVLRLQHTMLHISRMIQSEIYFKPAPTGPP